MTICPAFSRSDWLRLTLACAALLGVGRLLAADDTELDALKLQTEPDKPAAAASPLRGYAEGAWGRANLRGGSSQAIGRLSLDLRYSAKLGPGWRVAISDRVDRLHPVFEGADSTINTLREAYVGWQNDAADWSLEAGRINLRNGPAYGYNPTDFFREGSQRVVTTADPLALRDNRMGTFALRVQRLWEGGAVSAVLAPKLTDDPPSRAGGSLDLGATNGSERMLITLSQQLPGGVSTQLLMFKPEGSSVQFGANATALLSDAVVAHAEWSTGRGRSLLGRAAAATGGGESRADRATAGLSWAAGAGWSLTAEYEYNGFATDLSRGVPLSPALVGAYLRVADQGQDLAARRAVLVYATKKGLGVKNLDLTALVRTNLDDHSRLAWAELRYLLGAVEIAVQWQSFSGGPITEFGALPVRRTLQGLLTYRF